MSSSDRIDRDRGLIAGLLIVLGAPQLLIGLWALLGPHTFYENFGLDHPWVSALGAYDEHLVRDVGSLFCGLGVLMLIAAWRGQRSLTLTAVTVWLIFAVPHTIYHLFNLGPYNTIDGVANVIVLGWTVVGGLIVLLLVGRDARSPAV